MEEEQIEAPVVFSSKLAKAVTDKNIKRLNDLNLRYSNKLNLQKYE
jgi:hypothetical protein